MPIEFVVNGDTVRGPVTAELIARHIRSLGDDGDSFAILARDSQVYMQAAGDVDDGFMLEYRNGSESEHYVCTNPYLSHDDVIQAMQRYLENDSRWKTDIEWQPQSFEYQRRRVSPWVVVGAFLALAAAVLVLQSLLAS